MNAARMITAVMVFMLLGRNLRNGLGLLGGIGGHAAASTAKAQIVFIEIVP